MILIPLLLLPTNYRPNDRPRGVLKGRKRPETKRRTRNKKQGGKGKQDEYRDMEKKDAANKTNTHTHPWRAREVGNTKIKTKTKHRAQPSSGARLQR